MMVYRLMVAAALLLSGLSILFSVLLWSAQEAEQEKRERETVERRDQACLIDERQQKKEVDQLARTYAYLSGLSAEQLREPINQAVLGQLSETEATAREDNAARFCDEPGVAAERQGARPVGLPEPDPKVPCRPAKLGPDPNPTPRCRSRLSP